MIILRRENYRLYSEDENNSSERKSPALNKKDLAVAGTTGLVAGVGAKKGKDAFFRKYVKTVDNAIGSREAKINKLENDIAINIQRGQKIKNAISGPKKLFISGEKSNRIKKIGKEISNRIKESSEKLTGEQALLDTLKKEKRALGIYKSRVLRKNSSLGLGLGLTAAGTTLGALALRNKIKNKED